MLRDIFYLGHNHLSPPLIKKMFIIILKNLNKLKDSKKCPQTPRLSPPSFHLAVCLFRKKVTRFIDVEAVQARKRKFSPTNLPHLDPHTAMKTAS